jgi:pilus assembly protein CpaF
MEENIISMHEVFSFDKKGIGPDGRVLGVFQPSRIRPKFLEQLRVAGVMLPASMFERAQEVN